MFPWPSGEASRGDRKAGVPAVVESPRPTIRRLLVAVADEPSFGDAESVLLDYVFGPA